MRAFVHLLLFACGIAIGVGAFLPLLGDIELRDLAIADLRNGIPSGRTLDQLGASAASFGRSAIVPVLVAALLILLAGLSGSRLAGWLGLLLGWGTIGVAAWRMAGPYGEIVRAGYRDLLHPWGLGLVCGGLALALLALLGPPERRRITDRRY